MKRLAAASLCALVVAASGCGLKGQLYLPEKPGEVVVRPSPAPESPATPAPPPPQAPPTGPGARD